MAALSPQMQHALATLSVLAQRYLVILYRLGSRPDQPPVYISLLPNEVDELVQVKALSLAARLTRSQYVFQTGYVLTAFGVALAQYLQQDTTL